jgi:hypothetical protein
VVTSKPPGRGHENRESEHVDENILCKGLTLSLQETVTRLCSFELALHETQRLSRWEDGFPILKPIEQGHEHGIAPLTPAPDIFDIPRRAE